MRVGGSSAMLRMSLGVVLIREEGGEGCNAFAADSARV